MTELDMEIRKLPPGVLYELALIIESAEGWKQLMSIIPDQARPEKPKYTVEHINSIERAGEKQKRTCTEILFEEWGTSGRVRPTVSNLRDLLVTAELFRAAEYVSVQLLKEASPTRPQVGPAAPIKIPNLDSFVSPAQQFDFAPNAPSLGDEVKIFDYHFLHNGTKGFAASEELGGGAFGTVYLCRLDSDRKVAVKKLHTTNHGSAEQVMGEVCKLVGVSHKNLLPLLGYSISPVGLCLVYEFMENGSLLDCLEAKNGNMLLRWEDRLKIATETAEGIEHLHSYSRKPLIHRDIKSANILLDLDLTPKIGDFGLLRFGPTGEKTISVTTTVVGTSAYMAPEALRGDVSAKMDVFSFGVVLLELVTGLPPYDESREDGRDIVTYVDEIDELDSLMDERLPKSSKFTVEGMYSIAKDCLSEKKTRPSITCVVNTLRKITEGG